MEYSGSHIQILKTGTVFHTPPQPPPHGMKIITCRGDDPSLTAIASAMLNLEAGTSTFLADGTINPDPSPDYHQFTHDDITYNIRGLYYTLIVCSPHPTGAEFINRLTAKCRILDATLNRTHVTHPSYLAMDYTAAYTTSDTCSPIRQIGADFDTKAKDLFQWCVLSSADALTPYIHPFTQPVKNRNHTDNNLLVLYNTIVADANDIFTPTPLTLTALTPSLFSLIHLCVSETSIGCDESRGQLSHAVSLACSPAAPLSATPPLEFALIPLPIYNDLWSNIRPRRYRRALNTPPSERLKYLARKLRAPPLFSADELEEARNVKSGAPPSRADLCHCCLMYLYNRIYVLETPATPLPAHTCVCALCLHTVLYPSHSKLLSDTKTTLLIVTHPLTHRALLSNPSISRLSHRHSLLLTELLDSGGLNSPTFHRATPPLSAILTRATHLPSPIAGFYMAAAPDTNKYDTVSL